MNGHEIQPPTQSLPPTQTGSPTQKSFHGGLNNIISKLIDQKKDENTGKGSFVGQTESGNRGSYMIVHEIRKLYLVFYWYDLHFLL